MNAALSPEWFRGYYDGRLGLPENNRYPEDSDEGREYDDGFFEGMLCTDREGAYDEECELAWQEHEGEA